jgi:hypothetical protein
MSRIIEAVVALFLFYALVNFGGLMAPVTCMSPVPMSPDLYAMGKIALVTATGFIIGVILLTGKNLFMSERV